VTEEGLGANTERGTHESPGCNGISGHNGEARFHR
jgi:hypothetical protein